MVAYINFVTRPDCLVRNKEEKKSGFNITTCRFALYLSRAAGDYIQLSGHCFYQDDFSKEYGLHEDIPAVSVRIYYNSEHKTRNNEMS